LSYWEPEQVAMLSEDIGSPRLDGSINFSNASNIAESSYNRHFRPPPCLLMHCS
jgi:hypothetical protein